MLAAADGSVPWVASLFAAVLAIVGWGGFEVQALRHLPPGIRGAMIGSTSTFMAVATFVGVRSAQSGWVGAGAAGAFFGGMLLGLKGRLDLLVDVEHLPVPSDGGALPPRRQLQAMGLGFVAFLLYYGLYGQALFPA